MHCADKCRRGHASDRYRCGIKILPMLRHYRCPRLPDFDGNLRPILARATTEHWLDPCEPLAADARSELRPECRKRRRGMGEGVRRAGGGPEPVRARDVQSMAVRGAPKWYRPDQPTGAGKTVVLAMSSNATSPWLLRFGGPASPKARVLFLSPAGGSPGSFRALANQLPPSVAGLALCLPGRWERRREPAFQRMSPLIDAVSEALAHLNDTPLVLFGYSLGALIGFELARRWSKASGSPTVPRLIVAARIAPHIKANLPSLSSLADGPFLEGVSRCYGPLPAAVLADAELLALALPALRADVELFESYEFSPLGPLDIPISAFGGRDDPSIGVDDLEAWSEHTTAGASVTLCPGGHFFLTPPPPPITALLQSIGETP